MSLAGSLPRDLGMIDLNPSEMMFWMYLPVSVPNCYECRLPDNLQYFSEIVSAVKDDDPSSFYLRYVYLTVKTLWVSGDYIGNRPGWHIDGYGTEDVNYVWADRSPTEFISSPGDLWEFSDDCDLSMAQMKLAADLKYFKAIKTTYPDKSLLRLDNKVIHRSPILFEAGMRTFIKVSLSNEQYNLRGNSVNHLLPDTHWPLTDRDLQRNHPAK